jgi:S-adenosylmethionine decarboxylase
VFFEGSEKKAKIIIDSDQLSLLADFSDDFWITMVECCGAQILSQISNDHCKAFILSESSLFIWADRLLILTCGTTRLVNAVSFFLGQVKPQTVLQLIYQRKNEYLARAQVSNFSDDCQQLNTQIDGIAYRFGQLYGHHNYLYHLDNDNQADPGDQTYELLAYQISQTASAHLTRAGLSIDDIRAFFRLNELLPGFTIDDHLFEPFGYSLNAIKGNQYVTIHVTPQADSSYVSFESNMTLFDKMPLFLNVLAPASFDLICFNEEQFEQKSASCIPADYISKDLVYQQLTNGFHVYFANYIRPQYHFTSASLLDFSGSQHLF